MYRQLCEMGSHMENFDLSRLTATSFERMVRALCFELMGPGGTVYSSGPDGGRDFTFEGAITGYESRGWNGYLVLQAKFCEKPQGGLHDVNWLSKQLAGELKKYSDTKAKLKRPVYYIVATNIALSGADGNAAKGRVRMGGHTKIAAQLDKWKNTLGLSDFDIWSADKINDLLVGSPTVRQAYAAWITSGDVLAAALKLITEKNLNFAAVITRGLKQSLRQDQFARLKDAGSVADAPIRVSQVFIDLPFDRKDNFIEELLRSANIVNSGYPLGVVGHLAERAKEKLDPESIALTREAKPQSPCPNKIVILGGPGQGKSTTSMFFAQLFRATLLAADPKLPQDTTVSSLVPEILARAKIEGVPDALPHRYPVFISLPRFADAISKAKSTDVVPPSLLGQIADELSIHCDDRIDRGDLRAWLKHYPWVVILDGLDEVPPAGERHAVIEAIAAFNSEVIEAQADILLIVTSRPQGYNHELDPAHWEHWQLTDLPPERAIAYAQALGEIRHPTDVYNREHIHKLIQEASSKPATSRLMISPLQVTIMYLIVDTGGSVPVARWSLFDEYFTILLKREKAKGGVNKRILELNHAQLGPIHQRAGLVLQTVSEQAGSALSTLAKEKFKQMLCEFLRSQDFNQSAITERVNELMMVALERLVLLSAKEEGRISFDVRSLQEYMAAAAITSGDQAIIEKRLIHIAGLAHWRHVFLIAASRCFASDSHHHLRSIIVNIPRQLDLSPSDATIRGGALLALEMFVDGIGADHPSSRKLLARHALELLHLGPEVLDERLVSLVDEHTAEIVFGVLREKIAEQSTMAALGSWRLLISLANSKKGVFLSLAEAQWPVDAKLVLTVLGALRMPLPSSLLVAKARAAMLASKPSALISKCNVFFEAISNSNSTYPDHTPISALHIMAIANQVDAKIFPIEKESPLRIYIVLYDDYSSFKEYLKLENTDVSWKPLIDSAHFAANPSLQTLAETLKEIAITNSLLEVKKYTYCLPWPIGSLIAISENEGQLLQLSERVLNGEFGDSKTWAEMENRAICSGITFDDLLSSVMAMPQNLLPIFNNLSMEHGNNDALKLMQMFFDIINKMPSCGEKSRLIYMMQFASVGFSSGNEVKLSESQVIKFLDLIKNEKRNLYGYEFDAFPGSIWENNEIVNNISSMLEIYVSNILKLNQLPLKLIVTAYNRNPEWCSLVLLIAVCVAKAAEPPPNYFDTLHSSAWTITATDSALIQSAKTLLGLACGNHPDPTQVAELLSAASDDLTLSNNLRLAAVFFSKDWFLIDDRECYLIPLIYALEGKNLAELKDLREALKKTLSARKSNLTNYEIWVNNLNLPADAFEILR